VSDLLQELDLRASLLRLDADRRERRLSARQCIQKTYDLIARKLVSQGIQLTDEERRGVIPGAVLEAAVNYSWTPHPGSRTQRRTRARLVSLGSARTAASSSPIVRIPDAELTEQLGAFSVTPDYLKWWLGLLGGRVRAWETNSLDPSGLVEAPPAVPSLRQDRGPNEPKQRSSAEPLDARSHTVGNVQQARNVYAPPGKSSRPVRSARRAILKKYKVEHELNTMDDLARHLGVSLSALYGMRAGDTKRYSGDTLDSVLKKISCSRVDWDSEPNPTAGT
jgi:hypothetical protein